MSKWIKGFPGWRSNMPPGTKSGHPDMFCEQGVLRNFAKFTGKHPCQSPFFLKLEVPATLLKKGSRHGCFSLNFAKFLATPFFTEHLWWVVGTWSFQIIQERPCAGAIPFGKAIFSGDLKKISYLRVKYHLLFSV